MRIGPVNRSQLSVGLCCRAALKSGWRSSATPPDRMAGFMESNNVKRDGTNCGDEPIAFPLNRPSGTFSPMMGEKDRMRGQTRSFV